MDDPFIAILFSEDLIDYVLYKQGFEWTREIGIRQFRNTVSKSRFNSVIAHCVLEIIDAKASTIRSCYDVLLLRGVRDIEKFRLECMISTVFHFRQGYDHELYLNLCAMLGGLAILYFNDGYEEMASGASHVLAYVLNFYIYQMEFNARTDWFNLAVQAQIVRRRLVKEVADTNTKSTEKDKK